MTYGLDRHRLASHEAGHAVAAWCLGRIVTMVTLNHPSTGGGASVDKLPYEGLGTVRRPLAAWYEIESDCLTVLAGPLSEDLDYEDEPSKMSRTPQRVPLPVTFQDHDEEPVWPELDGSDADQFHALTAGISSSEREREALALMLHYRAKAMVDTAHFRALHKHLAAVLEQHGVLYASDVKRELQRAELRFTKTAIQEASDGEAAA